MMLGTFAALGWRHIDAVFAILCKYTVEPGQIHSWLGNQRGQLGNEVRWFEYDMGRATL